LSPPTHPTIPTAAQTARTVAAQATTIPKTHISGGQADPLVFQRVLPAPLERVLARALAKIVITLDLASVGLTTRRDDDCGTQCSTMRPRLT